MTIDGKNISLQSFVYGETKHHGNFIDHIDNNPLNARRNNLRELTPTQNQYNRRVKGYSLNKKTKTYQAEITVDGKKKSLGYYKTPEKARIAYLQGKLKYHGEEFSPIGTRDELNRLLAEEEGK